MICLSCSIDKPQEKFKSKDDWLDNRCIACRKRGFTVDTYIDEMAVEDVVLGIPHGLTKYEWIEVARRFRNRGVTAGKAADKVGLTARTMQRYYKHAERLENGETLQFRRPGGIRRAPLSSGGTPWKRL